MSHRLAALLAALTLSGCGAASSQAAAGSGIEGRVLLGPTCPVQRIGQTCTRPYATRVAVLSARNRRVTTFRSNSDGRFRVALAPGRYVLEGTRAGLPRLTPTSVRVRAHRFTRVTLTFDTGIR